MKISFFGQSCFEIITLPKKQSQVKIVIDPFSEETGLFLPKLSADILLVTHSHSDHSNLKAVKGDYFLISEPGEYEVKGVFVEAIKSFHNERGEENLTFKIESENLKICHLGDLGQKELTEEQVDKIGQVDILMIPVGGVYTISPKEAKNIISQIEPKIVIPMHYFLPGLKWKLKSLDEFLSEIGKKKIERVKNPLKIDQKTLESEKIIVFEI